MKPTKKEFSKVWEAEFSKLAVRVSEIIEGQQSH